MKFKMQAGAEFDVLTKDEVSSVMQDFITRYDAAISDGVRYGRLSLSPSSQLNLGNTATYLGGVYLLGGPSQGFVWSIRSLVVVGAASANNVDLLLNSTSWSNVLATVTAPLTGVYLSVNNGAAIIMPGQDVLVGIQANTQVASVNISYLEVPLRDIGKI